MALSNEGQPNNFGEDNPMLGSNVAINNEVRAQLFKLL